MEGSSGQHQAYLNRYRWIENGHIFLWLIKDTCWALEWKLAGMFMILPTFSVAVYVLWKSRRIRSEFFHNLAVCIWILANSIWMIGEFLDGDTRPWAVVLFLAGLSLLLVYYLVFFRLDHQKRQQAQAGNQRMEVPPANHKAPSALSESPASAPR